MMFQLHFQCLALSALLFIAVFGYTVDPSTTASPDTIQDCTNWVIVADTDTCQALADDNGITLSQFDSYNPSVGSSCILVSGNSYCVEQNWGIPPPTTSTISSTPITSSASTPTNGVTTPTPTQSGMVANCNKFYYVKSGDGCYDIAANNSISLDQFYAWNPAIGQCANLWPNYYVCVGLIGLTTTTSPISTPTSTQTTATNGITTPTPTQSGMATNCNKFYYVKSGDGCYDIAANNSISLDQFYAWNPDIGQCINLWPNYYVCVGLIGLTATPSTTPTPTSTQTTATNGITTPTPVQSNMVSNCDSFYYVKSGDGCYDIAATYGISTTQFYAWNPSVGTSCANLWPDYYVCVSIIGINPSFSSTLVTVTTTKKPTSTSTGNGVATPTPIQTGMTANCKKFYYVVSGDGCWAIANANNIALDDFYKWNPAVGTDCSGLWPSYYVCVGI